MAQGQKWDLTTSSGMSSAAAWLRKSGDAVVVVVIRAEDVAFSVDPRVAPRDAIELLKQELPALMEHLQSDRAKKKGQQ